VNAYVCAAESVQWPLIGGSDAVASTVWRCSTRAAIRSTLDWCYSSAISSESMPVFVRSPPCVSLRRLSPHVSHPPLTVLLLLLLLPLPLLWLLIRTHDSCPHTTLQHMLLRDSSSLTLPLLRCCTRWPPAVVLLLETNPLLHSLIFEHFFFTQLRVLLPHLHPHLRHRPPPLLPPPPPPPPRL